MKAHKLGKVGDDVVSLIINQWCRSLGFDPHYADWISGPEMQELAGSPVYLLEGLPFVHAPSGNMIPYMTNCHWLYHEQYLPTIRRLGGQVVPDLFYPMLPHHATFEQYLKSVHGDYASHMRGTKHSKVTWKVTQSRGLLRDLIVATQPLMVAHAQQFQQRFELDPLEASLPPQFWSLIPTFMDVSGMAYAVDRDADRVVAAMALHIKGHHVDCGSICVDHSDEYRPYSLVNCAQFATARWAMEQGVRTLNFGINRVGTGDYKLAFAIPEQVIGLTARDVGLL